MNLHKSLLISYGYWFVFFSSYDVIVDVVPEVIWIPENGYKNLKIVVEIDNEIEAERACEREIRRRHKSLGTLRVVTDRGLQVINVYKLPFPSDWFHLCQS